MQFLLRPEQGDNRGESEVVPVYISLLGGLSGVIHSRPGGGPIVHLTFVWIEWCNSCRDLSEVVPVYISLLCGLVVQFPLRPERGDNCGGSEVIPVYISLLCGLSGAIRKT